MRRGSSIARASALLLLTLPLTGCVVIPVPRPETRVTTSRAPVQPLADQHLSVGLPRERVLLHLGEPDYQWANGRTLVWAWTTTKLTYLWAAGAGYQGAAGAVDSPINYALLVDFDSADAVLRWETRKAPFAVSGADFIDQLRRSWPADIDQPRAEAR